jgi:hypothetical protein
MFDGQQLTYAKWKAYRLKVASTIPELGFPATRDGHICEKMETAGLFELHNQVKALDDQHFNLSPDHW